jgi:hypothetical protein
MRCLAVLAFSFFVLCAILAFRLSPRAGIATDPGYNAEVHWFALVHSRTGILNRSMFRTWMLFLAVCLAGEAPALQKSQAAAPVDQLIPWLLNEDGRMRGIPFAEVIFDTTGKRVLRVDSNNEIDQRVIKQISTACDETMKQFNIPESAIQSVARINELSSHFEDRLRQLLNGAPGLSWDFPRTAQSHVQRSGYPDLRIVDVASKRVYYLDPKLYIAGSQESSFRVFYFEPKMATNKVRDDAVHLVVGFEHEPREKNRTWRFTRWDLVDLAGFKVKLKAEFQGSNRDLYRTDAIVASSAKPTE